MADGRGRVDQAVRRDVPRHARGDRGPVRQGRRRARDAPGRARLRHARGRRPRPGRGDPLRRVAGARQGGAGRPRPASTGPRRSAWSTRSWPPRRPAGPWSPRRCEQLLVGVRHHGSGPPCRCPRADEAVAAAAELGYPVVLKSTVAAGAPPGRRQRGARRPRQRDERARGVRRAVRGGWRRWRPTRSSCSGWPTAGRPLRRQHGRGPAVRPGGRASASAGPPTELLGDVGAPDPAADRRRRLRPHLLGAGGAAAARSPRRRTGQPRRARRPHRPGRRCWPTRSPRWRSWTSTRSTPTRAASTSSGPRSVVAAGVRAQGHRSPGAARSAQGWGDGHHLR